MRQRFTSFARYCAALTAFLALAAAAAAQRNTPVLQQRLAAIAAGYPGKVGIFVRNIETGEETGLAADDQFPMASTYKVAIMTEVFRQAEAGRFSLTDRVTLADGDRALGSGLFSYMSPGLNPTIHDLLLLMITVSDNEATDLLLKRVGAKNVTATLRQLGIEDMRVDRTTEELINNWLAAANPALRGVSGAELMAHPEKVGEISREQTEQADRAFVNDPRDHSSPKAMAELLTKIVRNQAASEKSCKDMLTIMAEQQLRTRMHRYLENVPIASKSGTIGYTVNDVGIVTAGKNHIVFSAYTLKGSEAVSSEQAEELIGRLARATYNYFQDTNASRE
jgi:beta-lactamase class A